MGIGTEKKEIIKKKYDIVPVSATCDVCEKVLIPTKKAEDEEHIDMYNFYQITTHHHDWGNDSIDSYEYFIACCPDCALKVIGQYLKDTFRPYSTKEIEIERLDRLMDAHYRDF